MSDSFSPFRRVRVTRVGRRAGAPPEDLAATEEPLEIRLHDRSFAVVMRTPGADRELAAGFLLAEGVIRTADDLGTIAHCTDGRRVRAGAAHEGEGDERTENIVNVTLANGSAADIDRLMTERRQ